MGCIGKKTSPEVIAEIRRLYLAGDKIQNIATELGVSADAVIRATWDLPRREKHRERTRLAAIEMASQGCDIGEIARRLACPIQSVRLALGFYASKPNLTEAEKDQRVADFEMRRRERLASMPEDERELLRAAARARAAAMAPKAQERRRASARARYAARQAAS